MKLIVQIPAFNEENTIAQTLREIPKKIDGFPVVETLVIDDGSSDKTVEEIREKILDPKELPERPKVVDIRVSHIQDHTGEDALEVWAILDEATTDEERTVDNRRAVQSRRH